MTRIFDDGVICMMPWVHLFALPDGRAYPCCEADWDQSIGDLNNQSIKEVWNSHGMRQLRLDMLSAIPNTACTRCYDLERSGITSSRQKSLANWADHWPRTSQTRANGSAPIHMAYLDIRFSNLCNLRCRMCGPVSSSAWHDDAKAMQMDVPSQRHLRISTADKLFNQLVPLLDQVETANFAGGEPLMMEDHYRILEHWIHIGHTDLRLDYRTNFTNFAYKDRDLFDLWSHFSDVNVGASLDANHRKGEYLRHGLSWDAIVANRRELLDRCPHVRFDLTPTLTAFNALNICDFHREWVSLGLLKVDNIYLSPLMHPSHLSMRVLPSLMKSEVKRTFDAHCDWLREQGAKARTIDGFGHIMDFMMSEDHSHLLPALRDHTRKLDSLRAEDASAIFPELASILGD